VVHVGAGLGYYSAILAEIVGPAGRVTAIEIDSRLAERARANLARAWPQANVVAADGFAYRAGDPVDAIVVNAAVTHLASPWLDSLHADNGRLLVPLTNANLWGAFLIMTRRGPRYPVRFASRTGIIPCVGGRNADAEARLTRRSRPPTLPRSSRCAARPRSPTTRAGLRARAGGCRRRRRAMRQGIHEPREPAAGRSRLRHNVEAQFGGVRRNLLLSRQILPNKSKQNGLDLLDFIRPNRDFSMGYGESK
jgi:protein-L-isoaspartate O-methyltransferase